MMGLMTVIVNGGRPELILSEFLTDLSGVHRCILTCIIHGKGLVLPTQHSYSGTPIHTPRRKYKGEVTCLPVSMILRSAMPN